MHTVVDGLLRLARRRHPRRILFFMFQSRPCGAEIRAGAGGRSDLLVDRIGYPSDRLPFVHCIVF
jgi:hypothetical protein